MSQVRVLLVEDNNTEAAYMAEVLKSDDGQAFVLERAATLKEAKAMLSEKMFSVALVDLTLPDSQGIDTVINLRSQFPDIPIVVLSGVNDNQLAYEIVRRGAQDYLVKGIVSDDSIIRCLKYAIERKQLEMGQQVAKEILLHAPGSIIHFDQDFRIIESNAAFLAHFAIPANQVKGKKLFELFPAIPEKELVDNLNRGYSYAVAEQYLDFLDNNSNSQTKIGNLAVWPIINEQNEFTGGILLVEDITDRFELSKQRDAVMAIIAHDLKNPLLGSQRIYELLLNKNFGPIAEHQQDAINTLSRANDNCLHILKNLLQLFSYTSGEEVLLFKELDLLPIIENCLKEWLPAANLNKQTLVCGVKKDQLKQVLADVQAISYLLNNLISNALKYSPPGSQVEIQGESDKGRVRLYVADNGPGIPVELQKELFRPFGRTKIGNLQSASSGLGLFLCAQIMRCHQGAIRYATKYPTGAVFILDFPVYQSPETTF